MCPATRRSFVGWLAKASVLLLVTFGLVIGAPPTAQACSCVTSSTQDQFDSADVVAVGRVDGPDARGPNFLAYMGIVSTVVYKVHVTGVFKGEPLGSELQVRTAASGASCGWESIDKGEKYLVFATRPDDGDGAHLESNLCGGTRSATPSATAELIALAGAPRSPDKSIPKPNDPDQVLLLLAFAATTLVIGAGVWHRRRRQSVS